MIFYLQQSQARNYTFNNGFLNSTDPFPSSVPFEAPAGAILVNGLWFASLICSLATASFGMLVKQWLHEYLASESMSPKRRIIERHLRQPGLVKWKVYEIAGVLPILLHVALGLFFIGLCVFTALVDVRLGRTSIVLVSGWAFFIVMTTLAPLLSPRCPYKLPMLKTTLVAGRTVTRPLLGHYVVIGAVLADTWRVYISSAWTAIPTLRSTILPPWMARLRSISAKVGGQIGPLMRTMTMPEALRPEGRFENRGLLLLEEEAQVDRISVGNDLEFLLSIDAAIADDSMLRFMEDVVRRSKYAPDAAIDFVISLMRNRLGAKCIADSVSAHSPFPILEVSLLSHDAWEAIMNITADVLDREFSSAGLALSQHESCWPQAAIWVLLSQSSYSIPEIASRALLNYFCDNSPPSQYASLRALQIAPFVTVNSGAVKHLSRRFVAALPFMGSNSPPCVPTMLSVYAVLLSSQLESQPQASVPYLLPLLRQHPSIISGSNAHAQAILNDLWDFLLSVCQWFIQHQDKSFSDRTGDAFFAILLLTRHATNGICSASETSRLEANPEPTVVGAVQPDLGNDHSSCVGSSILTRFDNSRERLWAGRLASASSYLLLRSFYAGVHGRICQEIPS
jgi:hypothetical protein